MMLKILNFLLNKVFYINTPDLLFLVSLYCEFIEALRSASSLKQ